MKVFKLSQFHPEWEIDAHVFGLSCRAWMALFRYDLETYADIEMYGAKGLLNIRGCGMKTTREIAEMCLKYKNLDILPKHWSR